MSATRLLVIAIIAIIAILALSPSLKAEPQGQYYLAPGRTVIQIPVPEGVVLDEYGCGYIERNKYKCFAGQFAGSVYTTKQDALAAWRFIVNPGMMYSQQQIKNNVMGGRGHQVGFQ